MKKLLTVIVMVVVLVGISAVGSMAGIIKIMPVDLQPYSSDDSFYKFPNYISNNSGTGWFYAIVELPVGKVVKKLTYYHLGTGTPVTEVSLYRHKFGKINSKLMADISSTDSTGVVQTVETTATIEFAKVKPNYIYSIQAYSADSSSSILGIEVQYK